MKVRKLGFKPALRASLATVLLMAILLSTALPDDAVQADVEGAWTYTLSGDNATITGYDTAIGGNIVVIPDTLGGTHPVTSIGNYVFTSCSGLTSVTIPDGVTSIGDGAFSSCTGLTSVTIPNSVTSIGLSAFSYCTGLTSLTIPDGVTIISHGTFSNCTGLTSIIIPDSVTSIGDYAFYWCYGLTSVTIGSGVTSIGEAAFYVCTFLTSVTIPDSVTSIGAMAFYNCVRLTSVTIGSGMTSIGPQAFFNCVLTAVYFLGNAPSVTSSTFRNSGEFTVYYVSCKTGWTNPWQEHATSIFAHTLTYTAAAGGSIIGTSPQTVNQGTDGTPVTAVPAINYHFVQWSDTSTMNPRTDTNVTECRAVTAEFMPNPAIIAFTIPDQVGSTAIDADTVTLTMPYGTVLAALVPTIVVSAGASVIPASLVPTDFTNPVTYTVTAADTTTQAYTVTVTVAPPLPSVTTGSARNITANSAKLHGSLNALGSSSSCNVTFQYGIMPNTYNGETPVSKLTEPGDFEYRVTGLARGTTYYYRAKAVGVDTTYGEERSFTTAGKPFSITTATDSGTLTLESDGGNFTAAIAVPAGSFPNQPGGYIFIHGLCGFTISDVAPGATVTITMTFPQQLPTNIVYLKYQLARGWFQIPITSLHNKTITIQITDGGLGDSDGLVNGIIVDPGGIAIPSTPTPTPVPTPINPLIGTNAPTSHGSSVAGTTITTQSVLLPNIRIQSASLSSSKVAPGTPVTVTANIANRGTVNGSTKIKLYVNGEEDSSQGITIESGGNRPVYFTVSRSQPGTYAVYIGGIHAGSFAVDDAIDPNIILFGSCTSILFSLIFGIIYILRRRQYY